MNKKYTYIDGKVIVAEDNGNMIPMEYSDNLDEVLVQENLIEAIENEIDELNKEYIKLKEMTKGTKKGRILKRVVIPHTFLIMFCFALPYILEFLLHQPLNTPEIPYFKMLLVVPTLVSSQLMLLPMTITDYSDYKKNTKKKKSVESTLKVLEKQLKKEKEKLINLNKDKTRENENKEFRVVEVNDLEQLKAFRNWLNLCYDLGYNEDKYFKYYEAGKLDKKLKKYYNEEDLKFAKEYLEEKGPKLIKKKK